MCKKCKPVYNYATCNVMQRGPGMIVHFKDIQLKVLK